MGDRGRDWSDVPTSPGWPRLAGSTRGRREAGKGFGTELPEEHTLPTPGLWASGLLNYEIINFCSFQPLSMWSFVIAHPGKSLGDRHLHAGGSSTEQKEKVNADTFTILASADPTGN